VGAEPRVAAELGNGLAARGGFLDWVRTLLPGKYWTPELKRENFLARAHPKAMAELSKLSAADFEAIYPEGPIPEALGELGELAGFGDFAKANPSDARLLADAVSLDRPLLDALRNDQSSVANGKCARTARSVRAEWPTIDDHPRDSRYMVMRRQAKSPDSVPEANIRPKRKLDHNGAFFQRAWVPSLIRGERGHGGRVRYLRSMTTAFDTTQAWQIRVGGRPLTNMDRVVVLSAHGGEFGFTGLSTNEAAQLVADEVIALHNKGRRIDYVVLDSCSQRNSRLLFGKSNGQKFHERLSKHLSGHGLSVTTLVASEGGPTLSWDGITFQKTMFPFHRKDGQFKWGHDYYSAVFTEADHSKLYIGSLELLIGGAPVCWAAELYFIPRIIEALQDPDRHDEPSKDLP
jgi:hypothetical protein